ncbi:MAG: DUF2153 family protein [Candidatus Freyarchaeota archaeon]
MEIWVDETKRLLEMIKNSQKPRDRLEYVGSLAGLNLILARSVNGWDEWLRNPQIMNMLKEEELQQVYEKFKPIVISFLELDIWITEKKISEQT